MSSPIIMPLPHAAPLAPLTLDAPAVNDRTDLRTRVLHAAERGAEFLWSQQREDGRWCAELESNPTITAEYVFLCQMIGLDLAAHGEAMIRYFRGVQNADGSWSVARQWDGDISTTAEVYLALRLLGVAQDDPVLVGAERYILRHGGLEKMRIFTRIFFACFGLFPWDSVPVIPPEFMLLPAQSPVNVFRLSSWARSTMVPLFIIFHHRPLFALPNGKSPSNAFLDHLWKNPAKKNLPYCDSVPSVFWGHGPSWRLLFTLADRALQVYEPRRFGSLRKKALEKCVEYVLTRQEKSGDWGGIFPPMVNGVLALFLAGYPLDSEPMKRGVKALENFAWEDEEGYRIQACVSPVWDTVLSTIALVDAGVPGSDQRLAEAIDWVLERQCNVDYGDWKVYRPNLISGGWSFEYHNTWYPDVDDTAAVLLAILKQDPSSVSSESVRRGVEWVLGMQNRDGGWGAFDVDNDKLFLNEIPFSDMDSLCDPSSPDVTGRVVEAFGLLLELADDSASFPSDLRRRVKLSADRGVQYLRETQETQGAWFGRWGVNYVYGTSNVLCGLSRMHVPADDPMVQAGLSWLKHVQSPTGGWGENLSSYADKRFMGRGEPTASQTAWAVMGLLAYLPANDAAVERGVKWLVKHQVDAKPVNAFEGGEPVPPARGATWDEAVATGTGFPNHFYLRYHFYRHYFPMMALGRYLQASGA